MKVVTFKMEVNIKLKRSYINRINNAMAIAIAIRIYNVENVIVFNTIVARIEAFFLLPRCGLWNNRIIPSKKKVGYNPKPNSFAIELCIKDNSIKDIRIVIANAITFFRIKYLLPLKNLFAFKTSYLLL